jgi:Putative amidase domain
MKMLSYILILSSLSIQATSVGSNANVSKYDIAQKSNEIKNEEKLKVEKISKSAIKLINDLIQGKETQKAIELNQLSDEDISAISEQVEMGKRKSAFLKKIGKGYKNVKSNFTIKNYTLEAGIAKVTLEEYSELEENELHSDTNIIPRYVKNHEFTFEAMKGNKVKLVKYRWLDDPLSVAPEELEKLKTPANAVPAELDLNVLTQYLNQSKLLSNLPIQDKYFDNKLHRHTYSIVSSLSLMAQSSSLNRQAMIQYANQWWNARNPEYFAYDQDCTNYASQLLRAGGIRFRNAFNDRYSSSSWWYNKNFLIPGTRQSESWSVAPDLHKFFASSPDVAQPVSKTSDLNVGDIVQVGNSSGYLYHTMIVTNKRSSDSMLYLTGHTQNRLQLPVYDIIASGERIYTWKLTGNI